jgi:hypothetical protein
MSKRKTLLEWQNESNEIHNNEFEILEEPKSGAQKVRILHKKCNNIIEITLNNHTKRYCKFCSNKNKKTLEEHQKNSNRIHNNEFEILEEPINTKQKIEILHKNCGNIVKMTINNHINHKNGCKLCSTNSLKNNEYWVNKSKEIWGDDFIILEEVKNVNKKVTILHKICNKKHNKNMSSFIHGERGCPYCYKDLRYAEKYISEYLKSKYIKYECEKTFDDLINPKTGRKLRFDFYLPDFNLVIETHGVQHYKPIDHWSGKSGFEEQIYRDNIKENYLKEKNIKLIVINNKQLTKIKEVI